MIGLIDTHFHLDMYKNYNEIFQYLEVEKQYTLCMTNSPGVFLSCRDLFQNSKYVKFALGFHPLNADLTSKDINDFVHLLKYTNYVGEVGLDFTRKKGIEKNKQLVFFDKIMALCAYQNKIISVHIRGAEEEAVQIISKYNPKRCILHWYTGSVIMQEQFIKLGCYFSINANMLQRMEIIDRIPKNKLLIESDGPYSKVNGKKYEPQFLIKIYELIARSMNDPDLIQRVYSNFKELLEK